MSLATKSEPINLKYLFTIEQAAKAKQVNYDAMRIYLRLHPEIPTIRVHRDVLVRWEDIKEGYKPRKRR